MLRKEHHARCWVPAYRRPGGVSFWIVVGLALLMLPWSGAPAHAATLVNGDFEADRGPFGIPQGWVPFGEAGYESQWDGDFKAQAFNAYPHHEIGLYQAVPDAIPGTRYRLAADVRTGARQLPIRIGLLPSRSVDMTDAVWSADHRDDRAQRIEVEAVAHDTCMIVVLRVYNENDQYQLLQHSWWDNVTLTAVNDGASVHRQSQVHAVAPAPASTATSAPAAAPAADAVPSTSPASSSQPARPPAIPPANDVYANLANLWSLAWPKPGVRTYLASTHDPNPAGNADFNRSEATIDDAGETWSVLRTFDGPGAIVRIWMTGFERDGRIRIDIDGRRVIDDRLVDFFGSPGVASWPLANRTSGAWMSYVPMPFTRSARVLVRDAQKDHFYWQITAQRFDSADGLRPFTQPLNPTDAAHLRAIQAQWRAASVDPKPPWPGAHGSSGVVTVPPGRDVDLWNQPGAGIVQALRIDVPEAGAPPLNRLRIRAYWDGASSPQIDAPLDAFFGTGHRRTISRGLLIGCAPPCGGYCYFPMPFRAGARIVLANTSDAPAAGVRWSVEWVPLAAAVSPMRFHAFARADAEAGKASLYVPLDVHGRGHFVGLSAALANGSRNDDHFLEGDEYIWVDGEAQPSTAGTGTEDYFTCGWYFFAGPIMLAPVGAPVLDRQQHRYGLYRLHLPDWVPFDRSLRFGLEVGDSIAAPESGRYTTVAYYYLDAASPVDAPESPGRR